jgi:hypothetical protein
MDAEGDILYGGASGTVTKLVRGSDADVLTLASGVPSWVTPTTGDISGVTAGVGLSGGGSSGAVTLTLDLSELSAVTPVSGDWFATLDSDGANEQLTTTDALATLLAGTGLTAASAVIGVDASQTQITAVGTLTGLTLDGDKSVTPGDGAMVHVDTSTITDSATAGSGTATKYTHVNIEAPTLAATNASVTTSDVATLYINAAATAGTNQTITRNWAMWVDTGNARFDGSIYSGTTEAINSSGLVQVANQSAITGVSTITSGTWEATDVAVAQGGTGATSLTNLITLATHTTGDYVQNITAGTGLTSSGATSGENIAHSLSVDASQTQITSVGTVTTGTWSTGAVIAGATMTLGSDAEGDVYYRNSSGVLTRLAKGSDNDTLMMNGNVPNWEAVTEGASAGFSVAMAIAL